MKEKCELAYAKINMTLEVVGKRNDGYHELRSIFMPITLHDRIDVRIQKGTKQIRLISPYPKLNTPQNLMYKAALLFLNQYDLMYDVEIEYTKMIPSQAGLGGGSADGAAVLRALIDLTEMQISNEEITAMCTQLGADVPFCYFKRPAFVSGIGEELTFFNNNVDTHIVLIKPKRGASTKRIFENLTIENQDTHNYSEIMRQALIENNKEQMQSALFNSLEQPAFQLVPEIEKVKNDLQKRGFSAVIMSGSGSTVVCFLENIKDAKEIVHIYKKRGYFATLTKFLKEEL